jgi:hypothetical protein
LTLQPGRKGIKTVELVIEEVKWEKRVMVDKMVGLKIRYHEQVLWEEVKRAGGRWDGEKKVWRLPIGEVKRLGLKGRVTD